MPKFVPATRPRRSYTDVMAIAQALGIESEEKVFVVGVRGYYRDTMGLADRNDLGIYDDAVFLVSPSSLAAFNANTDPHRRRPGQGFSEKKRGMATLRTGLWRVHRFGIHKFYRALVQRLGPVTVDRDQVGGGTYEHTGYFGINIHRGRANTVSSIGCTTIVPGQWDHFIESAEDLARRYYGDQWNKVAIPYLLIDNPW